MVIGCVSDRVGWRDGRAGASSYGCGCGRGWIEIGCVRGGTAAGTKRVIYMESPTC